MRRKRRIAKLLCNYARTISLFLLYLVRIRIYIFIRLESGFFGHPIHRFRIQNLWFGFFKNRALGWTKKLRVGWTPKIFHASRYYTFRLPYLKSWWRPCLIQLISIIPYPDVVTVLFLEGRIRQISIKPDPAVNKVLYLEGRSRQISIKPDPNYSMGAVFSLPDLIPGLTAL